VSAVKQEKGGDEAPFLTSAAALDEARRFLAALAPGTDRFTFQTFDDGGKRGHLARVLHGTLKDHAPELQRLNAAGAGVFVMVNEGNGRGRTAADVTRARALFLDFDEDGRNRLKRLLEAAQFSKATPAAIVQSSEGKFHIYFTVEECPLERFGEHQAALAARFGGDPSVKDLPRVMRLPGFLHRKGTPQPVRLLLPRGEPQSARKYAPEALLRALGAGTEARGGLGGGCPQPEAL
jgi:hypothetical protein